VDGSPFSYGDLEQQVRANRPLRVIRGIVYAALADLSAVFDALHPPFGWTSIPPEHRLRPCCCTRSTRSAWNATSWSGLGSTCCWQAT